MFILRFSVLVVCLTSITLCGAEKLKVFVCAGQSNMLGKRSVVSDLPSELQGQQGNLYFDGKNWVKLAPGVTEASGFGPEITFAAAMSKQLGESVGIVKFSQGGTSLAKKWDPAAKKSLYKILLKQVRLAQASRDIEIIGMIWMQGEADSKYEAYAKAYQQNLKNLIVTARTDFKSPNMVFIAGRINSYTNKYPYVDLVRRAQENCLAARYAFIDCDSFSKVNDKVHYNTKGISQMGYAFAQKMASLLK